MNNKKLIKEIILERNSDALFLDEEFDDALVGSAIHPGKKYVAIYDSDICLKILMKKYDIGEIESLEYFQNTTENISPSENKPIFFSDFTKIKEVNIKDVDIDTPLDEII